MARQLSPGSRRWCDGLPAVTAEIACGGHCHRITWRGGKLVLEDHDLLAERSLMALGAEPPVCMDVLEAWRRVRGSEHLYEFFFREGTLSARQLEFRASRHKAALQSARSPGPQLQLPARVQHELRRGRTARFLLDKRIWELTLVEAMPPALRKALALSIIVQAERHWHHAEYRNDHSPHVEAVLAAIATPLFERSARRWRRNMKPYASFVIESHLLPPGEQASLAARVGTDGAAAVLSLPLSWFTDVWARGVALVDGCLVLSRAGGSPDAPAFGVVAVRWERADRHTSRSVQAPAIVTRGEDGGWSLQWV